MSVRDDHDIFGVIAFSQTLVEGREIRDHVWVDARLEGLEDEDVMVAAVPALDGPFVAEESDELVRPGPGARGSAILA